MQCSPSSFWKAFCCKSTIQKTPESTLWHALCSKWQELNWVGVWPGPLEHLYLLLLQSFHTLLIYSLDLHKCITQKLNYLTQSIQDYFIFRFSYLLEDCIFVYYFLQLNHACLFFFFPLKGFYFCIFNVEGQAQFWNILNRHLYHWASLKV